MSRYLTVIGGETSETRRNEDIFVLSLTQLCSIYLFTNKVTKSHNKKNTQNNEEQAKSF